MTNSFSESRHGNTCAGKSLMLKAAFFLPFSSSENSGISSTLMSSLDQALTMLLCFDVASTLLKEKKCW